MKNKATRSFLVLVGLLAVSLPLFAHHGNIGTDNTKTLSLTGIVTDYELANPHSTISFDVKDESGKIQHWSVEFGYLRDLLKKGWRLDTMKPGELVTVTLHPLKNGNRVGAMLKVTNADGQELPLNP
jgi:hypothetical protein